MDVTSKDKTGMTPLHVCVIPQGIFKPSFENTDMMRLLVSGKLESIDTELEEFKTPYYETRNELQQKRMKCRIFESNPSYHKPKLDIEDNDGRTPLFYAILQKSGAMKQCLIKLGAKESVREITKSEELTKQREKEENETKKIRYEKLYGDYLLTKEVNSVSDARNWRKWFYVEDEENVSPDDIADEKPDPVSKMTEYKILRKGPCFFVYVCVCVLFFFGIVFCFFSRQRKQK